ncbi:YraN family protein [Candidatus Saccharibacteria bacterium]|nr:YraN family protein [Candidatus Saccharibacteria bacterium]NIV04276.1 YraN family protein [Calditrichia bacterium]NIS38817.1 YraN family protein [Candidatus Saccharibacteria bacterium]NIV72764.1 YraN family protein [Calditrichia bacterium]NIV99936.1 YraN family protein [Candidatus Saccharibacteria bacterium]
MSKQLGKWGEAVAAAFLIKKGFELIEKNWRAHPGEIDLVMKDRDEIVFIEVKTRSDIGFGYPEESITDKKIQSLVESCEKYINEKEIDSNWRLDVISIIGDENGIKNIKHIDGLEV